MLELRTQVRQVVIEVAKDVMQRPDYIDVEN